MLLSNLVPRNSAGEVSGRVLEPPVGLVERFVSGLLMPFGGPSDQDPWGPLNPPAEQDAPLEQGSYASRVLSVIRSLHNDVPLLLTVAPSRPEMFASGLVVLGQLNETLLTGRQQVLAVLTALRTAAAGVEPLIIYSLVHEQSMVGNKMRDKLVVQWRVSAKRPTGPTPNSSPWWDLLGSAASDAMRIEGTTALALDSSGRVTEMQLVQIMVNGQKTVPEGMARLLRTPLGDSPSTQDENAERLRKTTINALHSFLDRL